MIEFRDYQKDIINRGSAILAKYRFLYLAMDMRTGKSLTSMGVLQELPDIKNVLFLTKKVAISDISSDYKLLSPSFRVEIINYESQHKVPVPEGGWDAVILDECHKLGGYPKISETTKIVRKIIQVNNPYVILMSGTPTPESYTQMYHQVFFVPNNPFAEHKKFYDFARVYVNVKEKYIGSMKVKDYSEGLDTIIQVMEPYTISCSKEQAGFESSVEEEILYVETPVLIQALIDKLKKDLVIIGREEEIWADTPVKLLSKVHQLCSGTIKFESGNVKVLDPFKAEFIKDRFDKNKIVIFYKFKAELKAIKSVFGDFITEDVDEFRKTDKSIALQIVSGREGISLKEAEYIVYYNIDFSATSYWQSRERLTTKDRRYNKVYWVFSSTGIEKDIYKTVSKKKTYTTRHFKRDFL